MTGWIPALAVLCLLALLAGLFRAMWRVAEPNEGLIISGLRSHSEGDLDVEVAHGLVAVGDQPRAVHAIRPRALRARAREAAVNSSSRSCSVGVSLTTSRAAVG